MKKVWSIFLSVCMILALLPTNISVYAAGTYETVVSSEAMNGIGGYSTDQGKSLNQFRVGGTEHGIVEAYNDASVYGGNASKDVKVGFVRFDLGSDTESVTKYVLKLSGGWTQSNRWGDINLFVALADVNTTIVDGETPIGDNWSEVTWNNRPKLITELDSTTLPTVVKPKDDATIDISELLVGKSGKVTIAVLGEKATADGDSGEMGYGSVQLIKTSTEWTPVEAGINIDFSDESVLNDWSMPDDAQSRFGQDSIIGNYVVLDGSKAENAPRTNNFQSVGQMIVEFDMMLPSKKADGVTDNTIGGGNTGGIALMQGTTVAGVIGFRGDSKGAASTVISNGGSTNSGYFNALGGGNANIAKDKWLHYILIVDTDNKTGDIYTIDPTNGKVYTFEGIFNSYIYNITSLTNIGIVSDAGYAIAIANLNVKTANTSKVVISAEDDMTTQYIPGEGSASTIQYFSSAYYDLTYNANGVVTSANETAELKNKNITYSVTDSNGTEPDEEKISINSDGLLSIYSTADAGDYSVIASCENVSESMALNVVGNAQADSVQVYGDEEIIIGDDADHVYTAIPIADTGAVLPSKTTIWEIEGESLGCSISPEGKLTVGNTAGKITIKATITENNKSATLNVYIRSSADGDIKIEGILLKNGTSDFSEDNAVSGVALNSKREYESAVVNIKSLNKYNVVLADESYTIENVQDNVQTIDFNEALNLKKADRVRIKMFDNNGNVISDKTDDLSEGVYKNIPLVADWITGRNSGLGMGAGVLSPAGAACGVDPNVVDLSSNIKYETDANAPKPTVDNVLWYKTGAYASGASIYSRDGADWERQALPIGNGYMGGMLFGMPHKDQIQINEETFWAAGYRGVQNEVASNYNNLAMGETTNGYMSVGNIFVDFDDIPNDAKVKNYYRDLNLDDAVAHVQYEYDGVKYSREYFASYPKEVLVFRYTADTSGALNFTVNPVSMHPGNVTVKDGEITIIGKLKDSEPYHGGGNANYSQESDLEYCTKIKVIADDGTLTDSLNKVSVNGATGVTIIVAAATDYDKDQFELNADGTVNMDKTPYKSIQGVKAAIDKATRRMNGAAAMNYADLKAEHLSDYHGQFNTVKFSLTGNEICEIPTDELRNSYGNVVNTIKNDDGTTTVSYDEEGYKNLDKHLEELHYNYARYMMISSSRSNTMPANLQGKWCQSTAEIWGSCYCININMEMNYWFTGGANLLDSGKSLIYWFNSQIPAGRITAKNYYKVTPKSYKFENGTMTFTDSTDDKDDVFIMHTKQAIMGTTDLTGGTGIQSPGNTAWLMYNLWDLYQTSGDKELLENELYPIMRKAANFYTQYLYKNQKKTTTDTEKYPDGYYYTTWSGRSPEQGPTHEGIKYDLQLVAGMYDYTIAAAEVLGVDADKVAAWKEIRNHLEMPVELGDDGQIKEWAEETTYNTDNNGNALGDPVHRHISHLVGLYPGTLINRDTPDLLEGAKIVLQKRGDDSTGWSCSNKFLLWARTLEGDKALELFRYQLAKKTYSNLFDFHDPFQIDGNFGSAAGVMELLMQSQTGDIYILPALPSVWDKGEISGIKAKNGAEVSIKWENNKATEIKIIPAADGDITIGYDKENIISVNGKAIEFTDGKYTIKKAKKDRVYVFSTEQGVEIKHEIIELTANSVKATGDESDTLIVAGYDGNGVMQKVEVIDGLESSLEGYEECVTIKAFLWDSLEGMKPYACKETELTK